MNAAQAREQARKMADETWEKWRHRASVDHMDVIKEQGVAFFGDTGAIAFLCENYKLYGYDAAWQRSLPSGTAFREEFTRRLVECVKHCPKAHFAAELYDMPEQGLWA